eukprot:932519-Pyramimonas_sp.AAC.1
MSIPDGLAMFGTCYDGPCAGNDNWRAHELNALLATSESHGLSAVTGAPRLALLSRRAHRRA